MPKKKVSDLINFFNSVSDEHPNGKDSKNEKVKPVSKVKGLTEMFEKKTFLASKESSVHMLEEDVKLDLKVDKSIKKSSDSNNDKYFENRKKKLRKKKVKTLKKEPENKLDNNHDSDDSLAPDLAEL